MPRSRFTAFTLTVLTALASRVDAQWGPISPGYPTWRMAAPESDLRIDVKPRDASVYVDGYYVGLVDEFDGAFQRLHLTPGDHEVIVHLGGYRSLRQRVYLTPSRTRKIDGELTRLLPGDTPDPIQRPVEGADNTDLDTPPTPGRRVPPPYGPGRTARGSRPPSPAEPPPPRIPPTPPLPDGDSPVATTSGTLAISVRPGGATVLVDGERWEGPADDNERLIVQVSPGRHTIEVQQSGYTAFSSTVTVRAGQTAPVNVSLQRK